MNCILLEIKRIKSCSVILLFAFGLIANTVLAYTQERKYNNEHVNWSSDGKKIIFVSDKSGDIEIYLINADTSGLQRLTNAPGRDAHPAFSPDGKKIVFQSPRENRKDTNIYLMNADGSGQTKITNLTGFAGAPSWSADGKQILFQFRPEGENQRWHIYLMNADGTKMIQMTNDTANNQVAKWSPDGKQILFYSDITGKNQLYLMKPDGSNKIRLTNNSYEDGPAAWSPDSKKISFRSIRNATRDVYVMNADGTNEVRLTNGLNGYEMSWEPGSKLLFTDLEKEMRDIFTIDPDGKNLIRIFSPQISGVDLEKEKTELLKIHQKDRQAHFETNPELLVSNHPDTGFISVRNGTIGQISKDDLKKVFENNFKSAKYYEWDDLEPPIIRISGDGNMAWMIVRLRVRRTKTDAAGKDKEEKFIYSGIMTYEKRNEKWIKIANVSTFQEAKP